MNSQLVTTMRTVPWLIAAGALFLTLRALLGQVALQSELNLAMQGVHGNIRDAVGLTRVTATALQPLAAMTDTLEAINGSLRGTNQDLSEVNDILNRMLEQQRGMRDTVTRLNGRSIEVVTTLDEIDTSNRVLLKITSAVARETEIQASVLERLRWLTAESIDQLRRLNLKFSFLAR